MRSHQIGNTKHIQGFVWKIKLTVEMKWIKEHFSLSTTDGVSQKKSRNKTSQKTKNHQNVCFGQEIPFVNRMEEHEMAQHEWLFRESNKFYAQIGWQKGNSDNEEIRMGLSILVFFFSLIISSSVFFCCLSLVFVSSDFGYCLQYLLFYCFR